jgi:hypothetical protein
VLGQVSQFGPTLYNFRSRLRQVVRSVAALRLLRASCFVATIAPGESVIMTVSLCDYDHMSVLKHSYDRMHL